MGCEICDGQQLTGSSAPAAIFIIRSFKKKGRQPLKKILAILTLVVMLVTVILPVAMAMVEATAACEHPAVSVNQVRVHVSSNNNGHTYKTVNRVTCNMCGAVVATTDVAGSTETSKHTVITVDMGHVNGTNSHKYQKKCSVCNYVTQSTYSVTCNNCYVN